jgi:tetratricopeptide (TPR) repeat protein
VKVWDTASGKQILSLRGHTAEVRSVTWSPDGQRLASAGWDRTVKLWDAASGKQTLSLRGHTGRVLALAWSPDGTRLVSADTDRTILVHDATTGYTVERSPRLLPLLDRRLAANPKTADWQLRAEIHARLQHWDRAAADIRRYLALNKDNRTRWFAVGWWVVGPYPEDLKASYAPEKTADPGRPVTGPPGQGRTTSPLLHWQPVPLDANGFVNFGALFGGAEHISAYALLRIYSPRKQEVAILLGSDDHVRLWLNGLLVHARVARRRAAPDQDALPATLEAGWNTLLARVVNVAGDHALYLRLSGEREDWVRACAEAGRWDEAEALVSEALRRQPNQAPTRALAERFYRQRVEVSAHRGEWTTVAADQARLLELQPRDHYLWYRAAVVQAHLGNKAAQRRLCRSMLERFGNTKDPDIAERTAKTCLLLPEVSADRKRLARLLDLASTQKPDHPGMPWYQLAKGLAAYRAGHFADALPWLKKSLANQAPVYVQANAHFLLAMAQHRLGRAAAARATLARALEISSRQVPTLARSGGYWHDWLITDLLRGEAEALVAGKPSAPHR